MTERQCTRLAGVPTFAFLALALAACADSGGPAAGAPDFTVRDSAGVELAVTSFAEPAPVTGWTIGDLPEAVYGESDDPVQFVWIRSALRLPDGRVAAIDGRANELFVFGRDGELTARAGGTGDGPGEFQRPAGLVRLGGDTLLVYDSDHRRFSLFDTNGNFLDDRRLEIPAGGADAPRLGIYETAVASGDTVTLIGTGFGFSSSSTGDYAWENPTLQYRADGAFLGDVAEPTKFWFYGTSGGPTGRVFGGLQRAAAAGGNVYVGDRERYEVRVYSSKGDLVRVDRLVRPRRPVSDDMVKRYRSAFAARVDDPEERRQMLERLDQRPVADSMAWISDIRVDALGNLWVTESTVTSDDPATTGVFAADGQWLGTVQIPDNFHPLDIGEDYLLGTLIDELDVPHLVAFGLEREAASTETTETAR